jgi:predicted branched-subunit amino acid permease
VTEPARSDPRGAATGEERAVERAREQEGPPDRGGPLPGPQEPDALRADERRRVLRQGLSVALATGAYGVSVGALSVTAGLSVWQACVLSLVMFTGGSHFAFVGIIGGGGVAAAPAAIAAASMLGVRNGLYGLELRRLLGVRGWRTPVAAHLTIDESTAVAVTQGDPRASRLGFWVTGVGVFVLWNVATLLGAVVGDALGDPRTYGLDAAACAAFTALLWPRLRDRETVAIAVVGAVIAVALLPALPAGIPVVLAALAALIAGRRR